VRDVFQAPAIALARAVEESNLTRFYPKNVIPYGICYVPLCKRRFWYPYQGINSVGVSWSLHSVWPKWKDLIRISSAADYAPISFNLIFTYPNSIGSQVCGTLILYNSRIMYDPRWGIGFQTYMADPPGFTPGLGRAICPLLL